MNDDANPSPDSPDAALASIAGELVEAIDRALPGWVVGQVDRLMEAWAGSTPGEVADAAVAAGEQARAVLVPDVRALLEQDVDDQRTNPLSILRRAAIYPTGVLAAAGVPEVVRDDQAVTQFPDDVYDLMPTSFGDIDQSVHEPGLRWGAAKAFVVLARRRAPADQQQPAPRVVAFVPDLMDRSKVTGAIDGVEMLASPAALAAALVELRDSDVVVVDLGRPPVIAALAEADLANGPRVIGFASHVDDDTFAAAREAGCSEVVARSVFFRRLQTNTLLNPGDSEHS